MADRIADDIRQLLSLLRQALEMAAAIREGHVTHLTDEARDPARQLPICLDRARGAATDLFDRLCGRPQGLLMAGFLLAPEEFHLARAQGIMPRSYTADTIVGDAYEVFRMFHYEDDDRRTYINLDEVPFPEADADPEDPTKSTQRIWIRLGTPPEDIFWERLRPEQQRFFQQQLPDLASRFKREA